MKKQLLGKIGSLTMAATIAMSAVSVYASDEVVKGLNAKETMAIKFIFNENDANLTESQVNELSELRNEKASLINEMLEKEYEYGLIDEEYYESMKNMGSNRSDTMFIEKEGERIFMSQKLLDKDKEFKIGNEESEEDIFEKFTVRKGGDEKLNLESGLQKGEKMVKLSEDRFKSRNEKFDLLTETQKNELTNLMNKSLELELKMLEKQYEFNLIEKDMYENLTEKLGNRKGHISIYYGQ